MNSGDKNKVSGKLADEGLRLIWVGIQEWRQNTPVLEIKNVPEVYLQLQFLHKGMSNGIWT